MFDTGGTIVKAIPGSPVAGDCYAAAMTSPGIKVSEKRFDELTVNELYGALRLRSEVFVVEQCCPYQDLDGLDQHSSHLFLGEEEHLLAYARWYRKDGVTWLGRIITAAKARGNGTGSRLMNEAIQRIGSGEIRMHAQAHLDRFYERFGFEREGEPFLEDGIPHVLMIRH